MSAPPSLPQINVRQEGRNARATTSRLNFLFPDSEAQDITDACRRLILEAESHFGPRWRAHTGTGISESAFHEIIQEIALHWMYFRAINHLPQDVDEADWEHPQTRRIIRTGATRNLPPGSDAETRLCADLMGLSEAEYLDWVIVTRTLSA
jgi:hypothetical protein